MFQAFIDDSGSKTGDKKLFLAGYIHRAEAWGPFSEDWSAALREEPALKSLHMTQSFQGWSADDRARKLTRLVAVLEKYRPLSIECHLSTEDFKSVMAPHTPYDLRHPYFFVFHAIVVNGAKFLKLEGFDGPLNFVFDVQGNVGNDAALWYLPFKEMQPQDIKAILGGPPRFAKDEDAVPLQAADMLAWYRRILHEPNCTDEHRRMAKSMIFSHAETHIPRSMLQSWATAFSQVPGIKDAQDKRGSVKHTVAGIVGAVPPERLIPVFEAISKRGNRARLVRALLLKLGLKRLWKKLAKRSRVYK